MTAELNVYIQQPISDGVWRRFDTPGTEKNLLEIILDMLEFDSYGVLLH